MAVAGKIIAEAPVTEAYRPSGSHFLLLKNILMIGVGASILLWLCFEWKWSTNTGQLLSKL